MVSDNKSNNELLLNKIDSLENKIVELNNKIDKLENNKLNKLISIDEYVDKWYDENKDKDIGVINIPFIGNVDILPDKIEKHIYKNSLLIVSSIMEDITPTGI